MEREMEKLGGIVKELASHLTQLSPTFKILVGYSGVSIVSVNIKNFRN